MSPFEEKQMLDSMMILVDTREQPTEKAVRRCKRFGCPYERRTLDYGDYTYNARLPNGKLIFEGSESVRGLCVIERKMSLDEIAGNFTRGRDRFVREFERASENNARVYLIIENGNWEKLLKHKYKSRMSVEAFKASVNAWMVRYNANVTFCEEATTPILIKDILYRDLKERIERGEFDG